MKVNEIISESSRSDVPGIVSFLYRHPKLKDQDFSDYEEVEDLFDSAYLSDCDAETLAEILARGKKPVSLAKAEKEAFSRVKFMIDHMEDRSKWKTILTPLAAEWSKKIAPVIKDLVDVYLKV